MNRLVVAGLLGLVLAGCALDRASGKRPNPYMPPVEITPALPSIHEAINQENPEADTGRPRTEVASAEAKPSPQAAEEPAAPPASPSAAPAPEVAVADRAPEGRVRVHVSPEVEAAADATGPDAPGIRRMTRRFSRLGDAADPIATEGSVHPSPQVAAADPAVEGPQPAAATKPAPLAARAGAEAAPLPSPQSPPKPAAATTAAATAAAEPEVGAGLGRAAVGDAGAGAEAPRVAVGNATEAVPAGPPTQPAAEPTTTTTTTTTPTPARPDPGGDPLLGPNPDIMPALDAPPARTTAAGPALPSAPVGNPPASVPAVPAQAAAAPATPAAALALPEAVEPPSPEGAGAPAAAAVPVPDVPAASPAAAMPEVVEPPAAAGAPAAPAPAELPGPVEGAAASAVAEPAPTPASLPSSPAPEVQAPARLDPAPPPASLETPTPAVVDAVPAPPTLPPAPPAAVVEPAPGPAPAPTLPPARRPVAVPVPVPEVYEANPLPATVELPPDPSAPAPASPAPAPVSASASDGTGVIPASMPMPAPATTPGAMPPPPAPVSVEGSPPPPPPAPAPKAKSKPTPSSTPTDPVDAPIELPPPTSPQASARRGGRLPAEGAPRALPVGLPIVGGLSDQPPSPASRDVSLKRAAPSRGDAPRIRLSSLTIETTDHPRPVVTRVPIRRASASVPETDPSESVRTVSYEPPIVLPSTARSAPPARPVAPASSAPTLTQAPPTGSPEPMSARTKLPERSVFELGRPVARVGDEVITLNELKRAISHQNRGASNAELSPSDRYALAKSVLKDLVDRAIVLQEAKRVIKDPKQLDVFMKQADKLWADEELPPLLRQTASANIYELKQKLAEREESLEEMREAFRREFLFRGFLEHKIGPRLKVELPEMRAYYAAHLDDFARPAEVAWREVLIEVEKHPSRASARTKADAALDRIRRGEDFAAVARAESEGPNRSEGGAWRTSPGSYGVPAVNAALETLPIGQVSGILEGPTSYHVVRVDARRAAGPASFFEVQDKVQRTLRAQKIAKESNALLDRLRQRTVVTTEFDDPGVSRASADAPRAVARPR